MRLPLKRIYIFIVLIYRDINILWSPYHYNNICNAIQRVRAPMKAIESVKNKKKKILLKKTKYCQLKMIL